MREPRSMLATRYPSVVLGRERELATLRQVLDESGPQVVFVYGIAGIGKTTLLDLFAADARTRGAAVIRLDCRFIEPTERGFLFALSDAIGSPPGPVADTVRRLSTLGANAVLLIDTYELFRLSDSWMRQVFVPALPRNVRVIIAGRESPHQAWRGDIGGAREIGSFVLAGLERQEARALLRHDGVNDAAAERILPVAHGHPLALRVAAQAVRERLDLDVGDAAMERVIEELTRIYLAELDPPTGRVLGAASVVRRVTVSLLGAMLPDLAPQDAFDRLSALPFVSTVHDGLLIHEAVREAVAAQLKATAPHLYRRDRQAAWRQLRSEVRGVTPSDLWRYTADVLYLLENPVIREAFFPSTTYVHSVEPMRPDDEPAVRAIITLQEPVPAARVLNLWVDHLPETFRVVRDRDGVVAGFSIVADARSVTQRITRGDPVARLWREHLERQPVGGSERVLFMRRWLDRVNGEAPSPVQAACWLDIKRVYMELRPHIRRAYTVVRDPTPYLAVIPTLGFAPLPATEIEGISHTSIYLDMGPGSVDGWLARHATVELGLEFEEGLDLEARELRVGGRRIGFSPHEFDVLRHLMDQQDRVVGRRSLLRAVWGSETEVSNVLEATVKSVRKKLPHTVGRIETVRGTGYRFVRGK